MKQTTMIRELTPVYNVTGVVVPTLRVEREDDMHPIIREVYKSHPSDYEIVTAFYFDTHHNLLGYSVIGIGSFNAVLMDPQKIMAGALSVGASALIVCHNHPSNNTAPSTHDIRMHEKIKTACECMDVRLLDNLIITSTQIKSIKP